MNYTLNKEIFDKNIKLLKSRFPNLYTQFIEHIKLFSETPEKYIPSNIEILESKSKDITIKENGCYLHSLYSPISEAQKFSDQLFSTPNENKETIVFHGFGLGYSVLKIAKKYVNKTIILIEPDIAHMFLAFSILDWTPFFMLNSIILLIQTPQETVIQILERIGLNKILHIRVKAWQNHNLPYYNDIDTLIERNLQKENINLNTLEKFGKLWLKNSIKNIDTFFKFNGIHFFKDAFKSLNACIIAAGPTLEDSIPYLKEIQSRTILICVDTALRTCLRAGIEPDFIVLVDPQYWNARHIEGLSSPNSILITEIAAYPSVFRFNCKQKILCTSLYPLGKFLENNSCIKGELAAGGSVASTAWDFARYTGCKEIFLIGVDLAFPNKKTHTKGSTFEERNHFTSKKLQSNETMQIAALYSAYPYIANDYEEKPLLSDKRMSLYAWWFESKCAEYTNIHTYSLSSKSIAIKGITYKPIKEVLTSTDITQHKNECISKALSQNDTYKVSKDDIQNILLTNFNNLKKIISNALSLCSKIKKLSFQKDHQNQISRYIDELNNIDKLIVTNETKEILSLIFPTSRQLQQLYEKNNLTNPPEDDDLLQNIQRTEILYKELLQSINLYICTSLKCK